MGTVVVVLLLLATAMSVWGQEVATLRFPSRMSSQRFRCHQRSGGSGVLHDVPASGLGEQQ
jgi:Na+-transporting methylmalonyl-CoA/oxaloacetate decarboxylase gamma subunit